MNFSPLPTVGEGPGVRGRRLLQLHPPNPNPSPPVERVEKENP